jgi:hypothetical protein
MPQTDVSPQTSGAFPVAEYMCATGPSHLVRIRQGDEPPHLTYHDSHRMLSFHGNEIRSSERAGSRYTRQRDHRTYC